MPKCSMVALTSLRSVMTRRDNGGIGVSVPHITQWVRQKNTKNSLNSIDCTNTEMFDDLANILHMTSCMNAGSVQMRIHFGELNSLRS
jgi:hypothetical protein